MAFVQGPITEAAIRYDWRFILCAGGSKNPHTPNKVHEYRNLAGARWWLRQGGNVGLVGHNLAVLDWDDAEGREMMFAELGPLPLTIQTARGKAHTYVAGDPTLPGVMRLPGGKLVGEIRRLPSEYVVCPPSSFQGGIYRCLVDRIELEPLPEAWRRYLDIQMTTPSERGEAFEVPERIDAGGDGRPGLSRHDTFFRWTRSWKAQGIGFEMTMATLLLANQNITFPPLDEDHLRAEIERYWNREDSADFTQKPEFLRKPAFLRPPDFMRGGAR